MKIKINDHFRHIKTDELLLIKDYLKGIVKGTCLNQEKEIPDEYKDYPEDGGCIRYTFPEEFLIKNFYKDGFFGKLPFYLKKLVGMIFWID